MRYFSNSDRPIDKAATHGARTASIISDDFQEFHCGICKGAEIFFYDVALRGESWLGEECEINYRAMDPDELVEAIVFLSSEIGVDIINISGGSAEIREFRALRDAVMIATELGTTIVAAAGNDGRCAVSQPARYPEVIGVGGIGSAKVAPVGSYAALQAAAAEAQGLSGKTNVGAFFKPLDSSCGVGLDVVAPSIGVTLTIEGGHVIDIEGTSFACPMVTSILALTLNDDASYASLPLDRRSAYARSLLEQSVKDVGLDRQLQGMGMPCWRHKA